MVNCLSKIFPQQFAVLTLKGHGKFEVKLNCCNQFSLLKSSEIFSNRQEGQNLKFHWLILSERSIARAKNWHNSLLSSRWRAMKSFTKIWIVARGTLSNISLFFKRKIEGWGVLLCLLSAATKTSVNWKLRNQKPDFNETSLIYVPLQHLSFPIKWRRKWLNGGEGASKNPPKMPRKLTKRWL